MGSAKKKTRNQSSSSSDRQKWDKTYNALIQILRKQANKLHYLVEDRNLFQQHIQSLYDRWNSDVRFFQDIISQKKRQLSLYEFGKLYQSSKADLLLGFKQRDALFTKLQLEHARSELDDFKACFDILSHKCPDKEDISTNRLYEILKEKLDKHSSSKEPSKRRSELEKQVADLKHEYEVLSVKHQSDISTLQDENKFVWNQYNAMEGSYTSQLKTKNDEINQANEKITNLLRSMEQLQSASIEKDETVATLRANNTKLEAEANEKDRDISRLAKEIEMLKSKVSDGVSLSNNCSPDLTAYGLKGRRHSRRKESVVSEEDATTLTDKVSELESEINRRNEEISTMSKELMFLRSKFSVDTPVLKRCVNEPSSSKSRGRVTQRKIGTAAVEEEASVAQLEATIASLKVKISEFEAQANQKDGEISALSKELKLLKSASTADTPALRRCTSRPSSSRSRGRKDGRVKDSATLKEAASSPQLVSEQGGKQSKRKRDDVISIEDTPKLFTSNFKIPRLRSQSPHGR